MVKGKIFFLDCVLVIMIISFTSVIPESCLERFFMGCVGGWKQGPLPLCLLPPTPQPQREPNGEKDHRSLPRGANVATRVTVGRREQAPSLATFPHQGRLGAGGYSFSGTPLTHQQVFIQSPPLSGA